MSAIKLVLSDVDGTLITPDRRLTDRTCAAVRALHEAGIAFAITSGRPPRGMSKLVGPLELTTPIAAFNGGMLVRPDLSPLEQLTLPDALVPSLIEAIRRHDLDAWTYRGTSWFVGDVGAPHVAREQATVGFPPTLSADLGASFEPVVKIVGISDDLAAVARCEADVREQFGDHVSAARSQPYYLDVTHPNANKGAVVQRLSTLLDVPREQIATIGDMPNDVLMFALSGLSIAMGNASLEVQRAARRVTTSNDDEGFANAIERFVL
jgi:Cof subfamily protein (haloacid dehalogenase superfamily)